MMEYYAVPRAVGSPKNDTPDLIQQVEVRTVLEGIAPGVSESSVLIILS
jgi:hypothetical protein